MLLKKEVLDKTNYFDENLQRHQEIQLILDFLLIGKIGVINEYLVRGTMDYAENRATSNNVVFLKESFFEAVKNHFELYDTKEQRLIYAAHYFEIILVAIRNKEFKLALKYLLKVGFSINAYYNLICRYRNRKKYSYN